MSDNIDKIKDHITTINKSISHDFIKSIGNNIMDLINKITNHQEKTLNVYFALEELSKNGDPDEVKIVKDNMLIMNKYLDALYAMRNNMCTDSDLILHIIEKLNGMN